ncbi:hypothetical protein ACLMJK_002886 [Lecanora helva]
MSFDFDPLQQQLQSINRSSFSDDVARAQILVAAQALCHRLETPLEWVQRMTWQEPNLNLCLKIADDLQLFKTLGQRDSPAKTGAELAASSEAEPALLERILRHLASKQVINEIPGNEVKYSATELSKALSTPEGGSGIRQTATLHTTMLSHVPGYLESTGYRVPTDPRNAPFQQCVGKPGHTYFEWMQEPRNKEAADNMNLLMKFMTQNRKSWMDVFKPDNLLKQDEDPKAPVLVDIGGGFGTDVLDFHRRFPDFSGRIILQELPAVIASGREKNPDLISKGIECQEHDFFTPEPVQGALLYFLGSILHDWPDQEARKILRNIVPAMRKGYSKLLLSENIIPATGCHPHHSAIDLSMMVLFGAQERTEAHWKDLLESEGLTLVAVHTVPSCLKSVIVAEKK